jgi:hypothetical protein
MTLQILGEPIKLECLVAEKAGLLTGMDDWGRCDPSAARVGQLMASIIKSFQENL